MQTDTEKDGHTKIQTDRDTQAQWQIDGEREKSDTLTDIQTDKRANRQTEGEKKK
jgi:hypothetical protein